MDIQPASFYRDISYQVVKESDEFKTVVDMISKAAQEGKGFLETDIYLLPLSIREILISKGYRVYEGHRTSLYTGKLERCFTISWR